MWYTKCNLYVSFFCARDGISFFVSISFSLHLSLSLFSLSSFLSLPLYLSLFISLSLFNSPSLYLSLFFPLLLSIYWHFRPCFPEMWSTTSRVIEVIYKLSYIEIEKRNKDIIIKIFFLYVLLLSIKLITYKECPFRKTLYYIIFFYAILCDKKIQIFREKKDLNQSCLKWLIG